MEGETRLQPALIGDHAHTSTKGTPMNALITLESISRRADTRSDRLALYRLVALAQRRRGFTLIEMMVALIIAAFLIGWYVRANDEADSLSDMIRRSETMKVDRGVRERRAQMAAAMSMNLAHTGAEADAANTGATAMDEPDASGGAPQTTDEHEPAGEADRAGDAPPLELE